MSGTFYGTNEICESWRFRTCKIEGEILLIGSIAVLALLLIVCIVFW